jgi:hypothetical protein
VSIILVQLTGPGILFGADRNITEQKPVQHGQVTVIVTGQNQRPKLEVGSTKHLPPCPSCGNGEYETVSGGDSVEDPYPNS